MQAILASFRLVHGQARLLQPFHDERRDLFVIFDQQDMQKEAPCLESRWALLRYHLCERCSMDRSVVTHQCTARRRNNWATSLPTRWAMVNRECQLSRPGFECSQQLGALIEPEIKSGDIAARTLG